MPFSETLTNDMLFRMLGENPGGFFSSIWLLVDYNPSSDKGAALLASLAF